MIKYGLYHKKQKRLLGTSTESNSDGDYCVDVRYILSLYADDIWMTDELKKAEYAKNNNTDWFNAGYDTPSNPYKPNELKVVKLEITINKES